MIDIYTNATLAIGGLIILAAARIMNVDLQKAKVKLEKKRR